MATSCASGLVSKTETSLLGLFKHKRMREVYIYNDEGTSSESVAGWIWALKYTLEYPHLLIHAVKACDIISALQAQEAVRTALIMPGGADLAYVKCLTKESIATIRHVVAAGGCYLGICAGAYFASSQCIFEKADPFLRVVGPRSLSLFPHPAVGAVRENFSYGSESGATVEELRCEWRGRRFVADVYCNGGPAWEVEDDTEAVVIARYKDAVLERNGITIKRPVAALQCRFGDKGTVVLCGVHPELPFISDRAKWAPESIDPQRLMFLRSLADATKLPGGIKEHIACCPEHTARVES